MGDSVCLNNVFESSVKIFQNNIDLFAHIASIF